MWCIISGLAKIQTQAPRKGQIQHNFSQAVNKGEDYPVMDRTGNYVGVGEGSCRASAEFPPLLYPECGPGRQAGSSLRGGWCLAQKQEWGPQKHRWADRGAGGSQGFQEGAAVEGLSQGGRRQTWKVQFQHLA